MNNIIDNCSDNQERPFSIGEDTAPNQISFQMAQDFYNEITGKSEVIEENSTSPIIVNKNNIEQLNHRVNQTIEQYNVVSFNYTISVSYVNDSSERYSSIERFNLHAGNKGKVVESISLEYRLLIVLPKVQRPQEYKITATIESREARMESMKDTMGVLRHHIPLHLFEKSITASFRIDFIDISVARAIMTTLTDWVGTLDTTHMNKNVKIMRGQSSLIPVVSKYLFLVIGFYFLLNYANLYFPTDNIIEAKGLSLFIVGAGLALFLSYKIGFALGKYAKNNLDSIYESSYINLSSCDANLVSTSIRAKKYAMIKTIASISITLLLSIAASIISNKLS